MDENISGGEEWTKSVLMAAAVDGGWFRTERGKRD